LSEGRTGMVQKVRQRIDGKPPATRYPQRRQLPATGRAARHGRAGFSLLREDRPRV